MVSLKIENRKSLVLLMITIFLSVVVLTCSVFHFIYASTVKNVTLLEDDKILQIVTVKNTVGEVLKEKNIVLNEKDIVEPSFDTSINDKDKITIKRAMNVKIWDGNTEINVVTNSNSVEEVLNENQIKLNEKDKIDIDLANKVVNNLIIKITRITEDTLVEQEKVAYNTTERETTKISRGSKKVVKQGRDGNKVSTYKVTYENGELISKELVKEKITKCPINAIVEVGIEPKVKVSRGNTLRYSREIVMNASAYTAGYESTGKNPGDRGYGITASGLVAQKGVVAVDPSVIPLGTKLYIESLDGTTCYGYAVAADTGGAIKGNKVDLFYETVSEALEFGRRNVKVYVLE